MRTPTTELADRVRSGSEEIVGALRQAAAQGLDVEGLTQVLNVAFSCRNQVDAAVTSAIGALDQAAEKAPDGEVTMALSTRHRRPPAERSSVTRRGAGR